MHTCQPLPDGRTLVAVSGAAPVILELNGEGRPVKTIPVQTNQARPHAQMRCVRKTPKGTYLAGQNLEAVAREYDSAGKVLREITLPGSNPYLVLSLPNGNLLISCGDGHRIVEMDPSGAIVWELKDDEVRGNGLCFAAGVQVLPNGNLLICNYSGGTHGVPGAQPQAFEITRDKKLVWSFDEFPRFQHLTHLQLLDVPGDPSRGELIR